MVLSPSLAWQGTDVDKHCLGADEQGEGKYSAQHSSLVQYGHKMSAKHT